MSSVLKQSLKALEVITNRKDEEADVDKHNADYHFCMYIYETLQEMDGERKRVAMKKINDALTDI